MADNAATNVLTGRARASYVHLAKPQAPLQEGGQPTYSVTLMIPKSDTTTIAKLRAAQEAAIVAKWGAKRPKRVQQTIKDGDKESEFKGDDGVDTEKNPQYAGHWIVTAKNTKAVPTGGLKRNGVVPEIDPEEVYSGCYVKASLQAFCYDRSDGQGVTFSLKAVRKVGDGEPFGAHMSLDVFADDDDDDEPEDEDDYADAADLLG